MKRSALAIILAFSTVAANASLIDTTVSPYVGSWSPFSDTNTATYGQTFTAGADNVLNSFTLYLDSASNTVDFKSYIYAWNGSRATGGALYSSGVSTFSASAITGFTFNTGGISLNAGSQYVAFLSTSGIAGGEDGSAFMPYSGTFGSDAYSGGNFVYYNNGDDFNLLTSQNWEKTGGADDVWFKASFSSGNNVPEPGSLVLLSLGLVALVAGRRKAKQA